MRPLTLSLALSALLGCRSTDVARSPDVETRLRRDVVTTVRDHGFVLGSPFTAEQTAPYVHVVRTQASLVRDVLGVPGVDDSEPFRLYVLETPTDEDAVPWGHAAVDGLAGSAFTGGFGFVYARPVAGVRPHNIDAALARETIRHEITHILARRVGLVRAPWFNEGLALDIQAMEVFASSLQRPFLVPAMVAARDAPPVGGLRELLSWTRDTSPSSAATSAFYDHAHALWCFLIEQHDSSDWAASVRAIHAMSDDEIIALEPAWSAWLTDLDVIARIESGLASRASAIRRQSAALLPQLAERGVAEAHSPAADALAIRLLRSRPDSLEARSSATFLLYFRAGALSAPQVEDLVTADAPRLRVTGLALRTRRGEPVDEQLVAETWAVLSVGDRLQMTAEALILGLPSP